MRQLILENTMLIDLDDDAELYDQDELADLWKEKVQDEFTEVHLEIIVHDVYTEDYGLGGD